MTAHTAPIMPVEDYVRFMELHTRHHGKQMAERVARSLSSKLESLSKQA